MSVLSPLSAGSSLAEVTHELNILKGRFEELERQMERQQKGGSPGGLRPQYSRQSSVGIASRQRNGIERITSRAFGYLGDHEKTLAHAQEHGLIEVGEGAVDDPDKSTIYFLVVGFLLQMLLGCAKIATRLSIESIDGSHVGERFNYVYALRWMQVCQTFIHNIYIVLSMYFVVVGEPRSGAAGSYVIWKRVKFLTKYKRSSLVPRLQDLLIVGFTATIFTTQGLLALQRRYASYLDDDANSFNDDTKVYEMETVMWCSVMSLFLEVVLDSVLIAVVESGSQSNRNLQVVAEWNGVSSKWWGYYYSVYYMLLVLSQLFGLFQMLEANTDSGVCDYDDDSTILGNLSKADMSALSSCVMATLNIDTGGAQYSSNANSSEASYLAFVVAGLTLMLKFQFSVASYHLLKAANPEKLICKADDKLDLQESEDAFQNPKEDSLGVLVATRQRDPSSSSGIRESST